MKKLMSLLLATVICLSFAACGSGNEANDQDLTKTETVESGSNAAADVQDERFAEGVDTADIAQYVGIWWSIKGLQDKDKKLEFFEDGRMVLNDEIVYSWKNYDGEKLAVYLEDQQLGYGYLTEDDYYGTLFSMETPEDPDLLNVYYPDSYFAE